MVTDIDAARAELAGTGVAVSEVVHDAGGVLHHSYGSFASFAGPDGNGRLLQESTQRVPGR
ncbi:VOC family protein [Amycolatopsis sp. FDAARGOS 1241]|uniref:VOC family protein n=1 Tax=Amycolatopsis sp. FDAARGOS 1241 TaxID=2778070 RepID=UPI001EF258E1|nr:hypothetical protein [Amycolatopsis sp. FDAARGOS 1241]